jgi:hypothetical protein
LNRQQGRHHVSHPSSSRLLGWWSAPRDSTARSGNAPAPRLSSVRTVGADVCHSIIAVSHAEPPDAIRAVCPFRLVVDEDMTQLVREITIIDEAAGSTLFEAGDP